MPSRYGVRAALLAVALLIVAGCGGGGGDATSTATTAQADGPKLGPAFGDMTSLPGALKSGPPWPANNGPSLQLRLRKIGLEPLREEGQVLHIHQHLDLYVDGKQVTVPAQIGIDAAGGFISDLHTHDTSGVMHVESPMQQSFSLGQFFAVWGVRLDGKCIGGTCAGAGKSLRAWVDGTPVGGDPTRIVLAERQEIVLAYGTPAQVPDPVPASYDFPAGL
jgi:hypothetical protein